MKNSAWNQRLWLKKLDKLPVEDADLGWKGMCNLLDKQMPVNGNQLGRSGHSSVKLMKIVMSYLVPIVTITVITLHYALPVFHPVKTDKINRSSIKADTNDQNQQNNTSTNIPETLSRIKTSYDSLMIEKSPKQSPKILPGAVGSITTASSKQDTPFTVANNRIATASIPALKNIKSKNSASNVLYNSSRYHNAEKDGKRTLKQVDQSMRRKTGNISLTSRQLLPTRNSTGNNSYDIKNRGNSIELTDKIAQKQPIAIHSNSEMQPEFVGSGINDANTVVQGSTPNDTVGRQPVKSTLNDKTHTQKSAVGNANKRNTTSSLKAKLIKSKSVKNKKSNQIITPQYNYGLEGGSSIGAGNSTSFYFGGFGTYSIKPRLLINLGVRINSNRTISGRFTHLSYHAQDSIPPFAIVDTRKLLVADIPVTVEYKLSNTLSIKAGALFILPIKQSGVSTKLAPIAYPRDTLDYTQEINAALNHTTINKVNIGFTGGISLHIKKFDINANYQVLKPYKIGNALGNYSKTYQTFQLGIGWRFR
ncbi:hypothetical protein [Mucilaginibacter psychrotolerans]|uniref:Outer membrane protein beta-barrel domain-containing protein n=1 Tax=Mucilaginibacter psychrotolerans TaxID=1524096 RepID=A0A4Y8SCD6_9SPHI|nr:hypothetical protein [Mucilaginibacter psychrotolerans]TFF36572.1 hypothetical protein E2R66_15575 [Mucilaginibacter psychrotolerans]